MFDIDFHKKQLQRWDDLIQHDVIYIAVSDIISQHIAMLEEVHKLHFNIRPCQRFYPTKALRASKDGISLIISNLELHYANDPVSMLVNYKAQLGQSGALICTLFGGATLHELRHALYKAELEVSEGISPRVIPMIDIKDLGSLAHSAGFKNITASSYPLHVEYQTFAEMLSHPKRMGQANALSKRNISFPNRRIFEVAEQYAIKPYVSTFEVLILTAHS